MTFQTFKHRVLAVVLFMTASVSIFAQEPVSMNALISQSLNKINPSSPGSFLNCIAELKRIDAMYPDSIQPKYQMALQMLTYSVMNPHAEQTDNLLAETEQTISKMEKMKSVGNKENQHSRTNGKIAMKESTYNVDQSDICTLRGFLYMVRIVQDPAQNGQRYYLDVMENYEKALKINPDNELAKQLQQKFFEGMKQTMEN